MCSSRSSLGTTEGSYRRWVSGRCVCVCVCVRVTLENADAELCLAVVDRGGRFLVSASGNRGWHGDATRTVFVHDIKAVV